MRVGGIEMGGTITTPPKRVHCHQSEVGDENNLRVFEQLFDDTVI